MELSKAKISLYTSLSQGKFRKRHMLFRVEGEKGVADTFGKFGLEALVATPEWVEAHGGKYAHVSDLIFTASQSVIDRISGLSTPAPVLAVYRIPEITPEQERLLSSPLPADRLYLMLDGVQDPGNLGTIIRTAHWFGIRDIFVSPSTADLYNPKTVQSTMGSLSEVNVLRTDLLDLIRSNPGLPVYGLLLEGEDIYKAPLGCGGFIVMGNEGKGLSPEMRSLVTDPLTIPPYAPDRHPESLNVAIATAVTLAIFRSSES